MLTSGSRQEELIKCEVCSKELKREHSSILKVKNENNNKFLCVNCRDKITYEINCEEKAYYLGLMSYPSSAFPLQVPTTLLWSYIRGYFDKNGVMKNEGRECEFLCSEDFYNKFNEICNINFDLHTDISFLRISFTGSNCLDFCGKIYDEADVKYRNNKNYSIYLGYCNFWKKHNLPSCKFMRLTNNSISPSKNYASDEGYDLTIISIDKKISDVTTRYGTGIIAVPEEGFHFEVVPRSSLSNSGYMLSNSIGIIDSSYRGELKICLTKIDPAAKELELPFKCCQLLLRPSIHYNITEVEQLDYSTTRGEGGFGSTDKVKK